MVIGYTILVLFGLLIYEIAHKKFWIWLIGHSMVIGYTILVLFGLLIYEIAHKKFGFHSLDIVWLYDIPY